MRHQEPDTEDLDMDFFAHEPAEPVKTCDRQTVVVTLVNGRMVSANVELHALTTPAVVFVTNAGGGGLRPRQARKLVEQAIREVLGSFPATEALPQACGAQITKGIMFARHIARNLAPNGNGYRFAEIPVLS
jgi:hypothetical protein